MSKMSKFARRVDQLDAIFLNDELSLLLTTHYRKSFKYLSNTFVTRIGPELDILFKFLFKYLPLRTLGSTFGQNLFQLQYQNAYDNKPATNNKLAIFAFTSICIPWFWERIVRRYLIIPGPDRSISTIDITNIFEQNFDALYKILTLINFCIFLQKGKFPSIMERVFNIRPLYSAPQDIRRVMDDNVHRELLWYGMSEFFGFILPLINFHKIKGFVQRTFLSRSYKHYRKFFLQDNECQICGGIPNFPYTIGCSHVFCYYCIASIVMADPQYLCFDCGVKADGLENIKPLSVNKMFK